MPSFLLPVLLASVMAAAVVSTAVVPVFDRLTRAAIWGVVLLTSFAGWGGLVARLAFPIQRADLGLRLAWGMAVAVGIGGLAALLSLATRAVLLGFVLVGVGWACRELAVREEAASTPGRRSPVAIALLMVVVAATMIQYLAGAAGTGLTLDDLTAYLAFPQQLLATGTLVERFSMHRMAAYGGQSLLHALTLIGSANPLQAPLLDAGICLVIVLALLLGAREAGALTVWSALPLLLVVTLPNSRANTTSMWSSVVCFLGLFRTATWPGFTARPLQGAALLGLLAAAAATLRQSFIAPALLFLAILYGLPLLGALLKSGDVRRARLASAVVAVGALLVVLSPWALLSYRSNGTPLFPVLRGYYSADYGDLTATSAWIDRGAFFWSNLSYCRPVRTIPVFVLAALWMSWQRPRGALAALTLTAIAGFVAIVFAFPLSDPFNVSRYYFPFVVAPAAAVTLVACAVRSADRRTAGPATLALVAATIQIAMVAKTSARDHYFYGYTIRRAFSGPTLRERDQAYRAMQASVPAGAPLLVMVDEPFWLDFRRNPIELLDLPGQVSPPPGMPRDDDEALVRYLAGQGYRYLAFVRSAASANLYRRDKWTRMIGPSAPPLWRTSAPHYLEVIDRLESLGTKRQRVFDDGKLVVLDLAEPAR